MSGSQPQASTVTAAGASSSAAAAAPTTSAASQPNTTAAVPDPTRDRQSRLAYVPRDARLMALILQSMGIQDVQPPALMMLLEFANRYLHDVLQDALVYADHANSSKASTGVSNVNVDDVQLAIQSRVNHSFTSAPNKTMLLSLASSLNTIPLPPVSDKYGVKLPPAQHCLTNVNFSIVPNPPPEDYVEDEEDEDEKVQAAGPTTAADGGPTSTTVALTGADEEDQDMADSSAIADGQATRGIKRSLDEDDEYD